MMIKFQKKPLKSNLIFFAFAIPNSIALSYFYMAFAIAAARADEPIMSPDFLFFGFPTISILLLIFGFYFLNKILFRIILILNLIPSILLAVIFSL